MQEAGLSALVDRTVKIALESIDIKQLDGVEDDDRVKSPRITSSNLRGETKAHQKVPYSIVSQLQREHARKSLGCYKICNFLYVCFFSFSNIMCV